MRRENGSIEVGRRRPREELQACGIHKLPYADRHRCIPLPNHPGEDGAGGRVVRGAKRIRSHYLPLLAGRLPGFCSPAATKATLTRYYQGRDHASAWRLCRIDPPAAAHSVAPVEALTTEPSCCPQTLRAGDGAQPKGCGNPRKGERGRRAEGGRRVRTPCPLRG